MLPRASYALFFLRSCRPPWGGGCLLWAGTLFPKFGEKSDPQGGHKGRHRGQSAIAQPGAGGLKKDFLGLFPGMCPKAEPGGPVPAWAGTQIVP